MFYKPYLTALSLNQKVVTSGVPILVVEESLFFIHDSNHQWDEYSYIKYRKKSVVYKDGIWILSSSWSFIGRVCTAYTKIVKDICSFKMEPNLFKYAQITQIFYRIIQLI